MKPMTDALLHPLTLSFEQGLREGTVSLDNALEFANRVFDAYLEAVVREKDVKHTFALGSVAPRNKEARHSS